MRACTWALTMSSAGSPNEFFEIRILPRTAEFEFRAPHQSIGLLFNTSINCGIITTENRLRDEEETHHLEEGLHSSQQRK